MTVRRASAGRLGGWAALAITILCVDRAAAQSVAGPSQLYSLSWVRAEGAEQCPDSRELARQVEQRLGREVFALTAPLSLEIQVAREAGLFRSAIYLRDEQGNLLGRRLLYSDDATCESVFSATVLAALLVIDPQAALRGAESVQSAPPIAETTAPVDTRNASPRTGLFSMPSARPVPVEPARTDPSQERSVAVSLSALASALVIPRPSPGLALAVEPRLARYWSGWIGALYVMPADAEVRGTAHFSVGLSALTLGVAARAAEARQYRLSLDAGPLVGALHASVLSPIPAGPGDFLFLAASAGVRPTICLGRGWLVGLGGHAVVPLLRRGFKVRGEPSVVWRQPALGAVASVGVGAVFP